MPITKSWMFPTKYRVINPNHLSGQVGDRSPKRLYIVGQLISVLIGDYLQEGLKIFDYGCGVGWLANMLSGRLKDFKYWGLEPRTSEYQKQIVLGAFHSLGHDPRVAFAHLGTPIEETALANTDVVYFGSVFTHLEFDKFTAIMRRMKPVVDRGGLIVFDCFLGDEEKLTGPGAYGCDDCYHTSFYIKKKIEDFCQRVGFHLELMMGIMAHAGHFHYNFRVTKLK